MYAVSSTQSTDLGSWIAGLASLPIMFFFVRFLLRRARVERSDAMQRKAAGLSTEVTIRKSPGGTSKLVAKGQITLGGEGAPPIERRGGAVLTLVGDLAALDWYLVKGINPVPLEVPWTEVSLFAYRGSKIICRGLLMPEDTRPFEGRIEFTGDAKDVAFIGGIVESQLNTAEWLSAGRANTFEWRYWVHPDIDPEFRALTIEYFATH